MATRRPNVRDHCSSRKKQREWSRPEGPCEQRHAFGQVAFNLRDIRNLFLRSYMNDQRVPRWPLLRLEDLLYCFLAQCVRTQAVYRFGWERDRSPFAKNGRRALDFHSRVAVESKCLAHTTPW